jgi:hypothetical protein
MQMNRSPVSVGYAEPRREEPAMTRYNRWNVEIVIDEHDCSTRLGRSFAAIVFDWDGTAVPDRSAAAAAVRERAEALCSRGLDLAVVSGTHLGNVDNQFRARPTGPGRLFLALNRGSEVFVVDQRGPRLLAARRASEAEDTALNAAATLAVERLRALGMNARIVSARLNRRKIDLVPEPEWADPPKAALPALVAAVTSRLRAHGVADLGEVVRIAVACAYEAGLAEPRVTSDAKHVEIGLTDKTDSMRALLPRFAERGTTANQLLIVGDEFGSLGGVPGSDSLLLTPETAGATVVSVGPEPTGVPPAVTHLGGGPAAFLELLD